MKIGKEKTHEGISGISRVFIKTTYDISLDSQITLCVPLGFSLPPVQKEQKVPMKLTFAKIRRGPERDKIKIRLQRKEKELL